MSDTARRAGEDRSAGDQPAIGGRLRPLKIRRSLCAAYGPLDK